jgi:hypothetical protein
MAALYPPPDEKAIARRGRRPAWVVDGDQAKNRDPDLDNHFQKVYLFCPDKERIWPPADR